MRPGSIEARRAKRRREAVTGVVLFVLLQLACTGCFFTLCRIPGLPRWSVCLFFALAVFCLAPIIPALLLLKGRFQEIEGGELDEAGKY